MSGKKYRGFLAGLVFLAAMPFGTVRAFALESLPGRELWQPYLTQSAQGAADFARDPVSALLSLLPIPCTATQIFCCFCCCSQLCHFSLAMQRTVPCWTLRQPVAAGCSSGVIC